MKYIALVWGIPGVEAFRSFYLLKQFLFIIGTILFDSCFTIRLNFSAIRKVEYGNNLQRVVLQATCLKHYCNRCFMEHVTPLTDEHIPVIRREQGP